MKILKLFLLVACVFTLTSCGSEDITVESSTQATQIETAEKPVEARKQQSSNPDTTMEYKLAYIDGQVSAERQYRAILDDLDPKCTESRGTLGDMTVRAVQLIKESGKSPTNLQVLQAVQEASTAATASNQIQCAEMFAAIVTLVQKQ